MVYSNFENMISAYWLFTIIPAFIFGVFVGAKAMLQQIDNDLKAIYEEQERRISEWINKNSNTN